MSLSSDISLNSSRFWPKAVSEQTVSLNDRLREKEKRTPPWWEIGAARHRQMRLLGETVVVQPKTLPQGVDFSIPSRQPGRTIPCRAFWPSNSPSQARAHGAFLFIHGGGWCFMSEKTSDTFLQFYADQTNCVAINVGYRLAPEHPFPAGPEDCYDAGAYFLEHSARLYGEDLKFIAGESAGAHLAMLTTYHILLKFPKFSLLGGLVMHFGIFDVSGLPYLQTLKDPPALTRDMMSHYVEAFTPGMQTQERKNPAVSPLYQDLERFRVDGARSRLPPALFTCGTMDPLLDDTTFMAVKWMMAGAEAIVRIYEGAHHGFNGYDPKESNEAERVMADTSIWLQSRK